MQTVLISGGTGLVGSALAKLLTGLGYRILILSRTKKQSTGAISYARWDIDSGSIDKEALQSADYIVHLAGAGVMDKRWTKAYKLEIEKSRTESSRLLVHSLQNIPNKVQAVISASAIGWYPESDAAAPAFSEEQKHSSSFLGQICNSWEESISPVSSFGKRLCILRIGIVLSKEGGALKEFLKPLSFKIAAYMGNGRQVVSWISIEDLCRMIVFAIEQIKISGIYNAVAPAPVDNKTLIKSLAEKLCNSFFIPMPIPGLLLKLLLGQRSIEILKSTNVSSHKIQKEGFVFKHTALKEYITETFA